MSTDRTTIPSQESVRGELLEHLSSALKITVVPAQDLFADGLVSSMAAMQLVLHLEQTYGIEVAGRDLQLENFRTVEAMAALVLRLMAP